MKKARWTFRVVAATRHRKFTDRWKRQCGFRAIKEKTHILLWCRLFAEHCRLLKHGHTAP